jgi:hypothetical protein
MHVNVQKSLKNQDWAGGKYHGKTKKKSTKYEEG